MLGKKLGRGHETHHLSIFLSLIILILGRGAVYREVSAPVLVHRQYRRHIPTAVAVVGRAPDSDELLVEHVLVALLHKLVGARDEPQRVDMVELLRDARAKEPACTARAHSPVLDLVGIRPHQIWRRR